MADWINRILDTYCEWLLPTEWEAPGYILAALIHSVLLLNVVAVGALFFIWLERKVSGRIQDRLGPTRVGGKFGWLQTLADGLKLITKEDLIPKEADRLLFKLAPYVSFAASYAAYLALPFADGWVARHVNVAVFFVLAVLGLEVFGVILAGYASGSKWSLFGAMREAAQVVSYEVPLGLCVVVPVLICGTMNLVAISNMQAGLFTNWLIFHDPFTFLIFWVFVTCAVASVNRAPFDLAEAESELVAGFHTEYSGLRWSVFFMAEYGSMFMVGGLASILFLGGWHGPIPIFGPDMLDWSYSQTEISQGVFRPTGYIANLAGCVNFILKSVVGVTAMIWIRWTLPRLRIDQVITTCLKYCVPVGAVCFLGAVFWQALELPSLNDLPVMNTIIVQRKYQHKSTGELISEGNYVGMEWSDQKNYQLTDRDQWDIGRGRATVRESWMLRLTPTTSAVQESDTPADPTAPEQESVGADDSPASASFARLQETSLQETRRLESAKGGSQ